MLYNELRKDYLLDRWVVIAKERARRPSDLAKSRPAITNNLVCPLCVGNENMTPPATMLFQKLNGAIKCSQDPLSGERPKDWRVRVIPNLYPAFTQPKNPGSAEPIFTSSTFGYAIGDHEVVVESPIHNEEPADAELTQLELVIYAYIERLKYFNSKPFVKYVSIFRNYGIEAGASLSHSHSQIVATPMVPKILEDEYTASKAYFKEHKRCVFCEIIEKETKGLRFVMENKDFVVFAPFASVNPMEFWIVPKKHAQNIQSLTASEVSAFAKTLKTSLKALKDVVNDPPYNYAFHLSIDPKTEMFYHWHLEVYPKLAIWAGFEKSTGVYINTVTPESAAESLQKAINL
jgi:UDPglucose--hexose-1-phosphate uridylyltransferase